MANLERTYIIPLRREFIKVARYKRAKKAVNAVKTFLTRHMRSEDIKLGNVLNNELWKRGIESPPGKVKVTVTKDDKGTVKAELFGHKYVDKIKIEKAEKSKLEQLKEKMIGKEAEKKEHDKELTHEHSHDHHDHDHGTTLVAKSRGHYEFHPHRLTGESDSNCRHRFAVYDPRTGIRIRPPVFP